MAGSFDIDNELTQLQHWAKLRLKAGSNMIAWHATSLVDWELMQSLQCIDLSGPFELKACLLHLTAVCSLTEVASSSGCSHDRTGALLFRHVYQLAVHHPHVLVKMDAVSALALPSHSQY